MVEVLSGVVGLILGAALVAVVLTRRSQSLRVTSATLERELAVRDSQFAGAQEDLRRARGEHDEAIRNLAVTFESLSHRVLAQTVEQFNQAQEQVAKERESKLGLTLKPLESLLDEYKRNLADFNKEHTGALSDVKSRASELLEAQLRTQAETRRLSQLLGRGDQRGHWGEIQLVNVMEASGLRPNVDYLLQVTGANDAGRSLRPDCVVKMPNGASIAVDAKFPFDAFEVALRTDDVEERRSLHQAHAEALRGHVKKLREKSYWELITPAPEFVVCFVPSDFAITVAFEADPELHRYAAKEHVLIVGPTNLLSLLWSVAMVLRQHDAKINAEEILSQAEKLYDRMRVVAEHVARMGKSLNDSVNAYNDMVSSIESRLVVTAKGIRRLGGAQRAKTIPELESVDRLATTLNEERWGVDPDNPLPEGVAELIELEADEE